MADNLFVGSIETRSHRFLYLHKVSSSFYYKQRIQDLISPSLVADSKEDEIMFGTFLLTLQSDLEIDPLIRNNAPI